MPKIFSSAIVTEFESTVDHTHILNKIFLYIAHLMPERA